MRYGIPMTRRDWLAALSILPVVRALDLVKVTFWVDGVFIVRWEPRAVAEARVRAVSDFIAGMGSARLT